MSNQTSSSEVFQLALSWMKQCDWKCNPPCASLQPVWYPTRLIDIRALKSQAYLWTTRNQYAAYENPHTLREFEMVTVKLVERPREDPHDGLGIFGEAVGYSKQPNNLYVTLSHCWGQSQRYTLSPNTAADLKKGIKIEKLPNTFKDAIHFASQLHNVGWIWIDSLCIYQDGPDAEGDWLSEAALMPQVYQQSYLNLSATAASNSGEGLFSERDCRTLWENEVSLKVDGIPGLALREDGYPHGQKTENLRPRQGRFLSSFRKWFADAFRAPATGVQAEAVVKIDWGGKPLTLAVPEPERLRRVVVIDTSHWDNIVNKAPVNLRAWVLQERLLASRVLHFCKGSIAWECGGFTRAEGHPSGLRGFQLHGDRILPQVPLRSFDRLKHGQELRKIRLGDSMEHDPQIPEEDLYGFELWARLVETYSRMNLTMDKDKLIALSGIAEVMSTTVLGSKEAPAQYVSGLWRKYLESQLLWRVEPTFIRHNRTFQQPGRRPQEFRAPSFSWASVDAQMGHGDHPSNSITYGEVTDRDLLIEIEKGDNGVVIMIRTDNCFGVVTGGHIMLYGRLRKIKLSKGEQPGRFYWRLLERNAVYANIDRERHHNVYLDAPDDDERLHGIFESGKVYCLPVARGPRSEDKDSKYIICLILLQADDDDHEQVRSLKRAEQKATFRRIGMTKLSAWGDRLTYENIMTPHAKDFGLPCWPHEFDEVKKRHLIRII